MNDPHTNRPRNSAGNAPQKDATQRVRLEDMPQRPRRSTAASYSENPRRGRSHMNQKEKITLISLASVAVILLVAAVIMISSMFTATPDDGLILKGVVAAGVNLGGMTPEEATAALKEATDNTYTTHGMTVKVLETEIVLTPEKTGAKLDVEAVVQDAYNYGRTGSRAEREQAKNQALASSVTIPITSYLNLDTDYIREEINKLGDLYSSTLSQPTITLDPNGKKPSMDVDKPDTTVVHQTLSIYVGTPEYGLDTNKLYDQVLEYYSMNILQVVFVPFVEYPESIEGDLLTYYEDLCEAPMDARYDSETGEITEKYGYGFVLEDVKEQIAQAAPGSTLTIPLTYLAPGITSDMILGEWFEDALGSATSTIKPMETPITTPEATPDGTPVVTEDPWKKNVILACEKLNGFIIKADGTFSFNEILGELTAENGYREAVAYVGRTPTKVMGGGVSQVASVLYNCALQAELEIVERHGHAYAVQFAPVGLDAYVNSSPNGSVADFKFSNKSGTPLLIKAAVVDNVIEISIMGVETRTYQTKIEVVTKETVTPGTLNSIMISNNPGGYVDGQVLVAGINGYHVEVYVNQHTGGASEPSKKFIGEFTYDARDAVVVKLQEMTPEVPDIPPETDPETPVLPE